MRTRIVAGNWKMNTTAATAAELASGVVAGVGMGIEGTEVVVCPPFPFLVTIAQLLDGSEVKLGAQTMHDQKEGAFTGEVSGRMLRSVGCTYVIVGHSERRMMFAESDLDVCRRTNAAVDAGLRPIICVGETEAERENGRTNRILERQVRSALDGIFDFNVRNCVFAYEPIWAIGTGNTAAPEQATEAHAFIREVIASTFGSVVAGDISILYGGSLNGANAGAILTQPHVDGGLVGGASLDAAGFGEIVRATMTPAGSAE